MNKSIFIFLLCIFTMNLYYCEGVISKINKNLGTSTLKIKNPQDIESIKQHYHELRTELLWHCVTFNKPWNQATLNLEITFPNTDFIDAPITISGPALLSLLKPNQDSAFDSKAESKFNCNTCLEALKNSFKLLQACVYGFEHDSKEKIFDHYKQMKVQFDFLEDNCKITLSGITKMKKTANDYKMDQLSQYEQELEKLQKDIKKYRKQNFLAP